MSTPLANVVTQLAAFGVNAGVLTYTYDPVAPVGNVISNFTPFLDWRYFGQYVPLTVSEGPVPVTTVATVPNVVNKYYYDAQLAILDARLLIAPPKYVLAPQVVPGIVLTQSLAAGAIEREQTQMTITVASLPGTNGLPGTTVNVGNFIFGVSGFGTGAF